MRIFIFISILILSQLQAQIVIFGASKNEDTRDKNMEILYLEVSKNRELQELQEHYNFEYSKEKFGDFFAIAVYNINNKQLNKKLFFLLRPIFEDIFIIESKRETILYTQNKKLEEEEYTLIDKVLRYVLLIDKWYIISILTIFGLIFLYKRFKKLKEIKGMQKNFKDNQDIMQDKLDNLM